MKKLLVLLLFVAASASAAEKWSDAYNRGVAAVNAKSYKAGAESLQKAIAEMPSEGTAVRTGNTIMTYVPHFWLGIAKFNLGDTDGALREWRMSEEQGAIQRTEYYSRLKDWVARAQTEKQRTAQSEAAGPKKAADTAISKALAAQVDALSAGADRSDRYRAAARKLQEAMTQFRAAGTDVVVYKSAELTAQQASSLFAAAADEAKKQKAARPPEKKPVIVDTVVPVEEKPKPEPPVKTEPVVVPPTETVAQKPPVPVTPVESEAKVAASLAVQQYRRNIAAAPAAIQGAELREADALRKQLDTAKSDAELDRIARAASQRDLALAKKVAEAKNVPAAPVEATVTVAITPDDLREAYRAYATGDLASAERMLTRSLATRQSPEALLLRGCTRYTQAMLSRTPDPLLAKAADDFRAALDRNRALQLDKAAFSPKLIAFFERIRTKR